MKDDAKTVTLANVASGAAPVLFAEAFDKILRDIEDPNTKAKVKRSVRLTFTVTPEENRRTLGVEVAVETTTAKRRGHAGQMFIVHRDGQLGAVNFDPRQLDIESELEAAAREAAEGDEVQEAAVEVVAVVK